MGSHNSRLPEGLRRSRFDPRSRPSRRNPRQQSGKPDLKEFGYPRWFEVVGWIAVFIGIYLSVPSLGQHNNFEIHWGFLLISAIFGIPLILLRRGVKIKIDETSIASSNIFGIKRKILWKDVNKVEFSSDVLTIKDKNESIALSIYMNNIPETAELMIEKLSWDLIRDAFIDLKKAGGVAALPEEDSKVDSP